MDADIEKAAEDVPGGLHTSPAQGLRRRSSRARLDALHGTEAAHLVRARARPRTEDLILDEATSSVDTETEFRVRDALSRMVEGRTSLIIAHRLSTVQRADKIIVMHKGQLREMGTHQQLLAQRGIYFKLYQLQYKDQEIAVGRSQTPESTVSADD